MTGTALRDQTSGLKESTATVQQWPEGSRVHPAISCQHVPVATQSQRVREPRQCRPKGSGPGAQGRLKKRSGETNGERQLREH